MSPGTSPNAPPPADAGGGRPLDLAAFLAVLVTGMILIAVTHAGAVALTGFSTTTAALYAAWRRR
jgi:hypothetical protein